VFAQGILWRLYDNIGVFDVFADLVFQQLVKNIFAFSVSKTRSSRGYGTAYRVFDSCCQLQGVFTAYITLITVYYRHWYGMVY